MIPRNSCQDGCWVESRGGKIKLNLDNKKLEKLKILLTFCNKTDSYNLK